MSIGTEFIAANPFDEFFDGYSVEIAHAETARFMEWVAKEYPGEYVGSPTNVKTFTAFFDANEIPYTFRNCRIAFVYLRCEGLFEKETSDAESEPEPKVKYSRPTIMRAFKTAEDRQQDAELVSTLREIDRATRSPKDAWNRSTVDVCPDLRRLVADSRAANRNQGKKKHFSLGESRAMVSAQHPDIPADSPRFNEFVAWLMYDQND